jgi:hypothetical protein
MRVAITFLTRATMAPRFVSYSHIISGLLSLLFITPSTALVTKRGVSPAASSELQSGWTYVGCYSDEQNARTLSAATYANNTVMDAAACVQYCSNKGYIYAGTEYTDGKSRSYWNYLDGKIAPPNMYLTPAQNAIVATP